MLWTYYAEVMRVVDGDTLDLNVDTGFQNRHRASFRLLDCWTPELYSGSDRDLWMDAGRFVVRWLGCADWAVWWQDVSPKTRKRGWHIQGVRPCVLIRSHDGRKLGKGKYGRWLVEVYRGNATYLDGDLHSPMSLNHALVESGHATRTKEG